VLADVDPLNVTDGMLDDLWTQVARLHAARLAHGALNTHHIALSRDGPAIFEFSSASVASQNDRRPADVAELLVATA